MNYVGTKYPDIEVTRDGAVAIVEIQRPPHNFFDVLLIHQIADAFNTLDDDMSCRAVVLASQGKSFCAGANFGSGNEERVLATKSLRRKVFETERAHYMKKAFGCSVRRNL